MKGIYKSISKQLSCYRLPYELFNHLLYYSFPYTELMAELVSSPRNFCNPCSPQELNQLMYELTSVY